MRSAINVEPVEPTLVIRGTESAREAIGELRPGMRVIGLTKGQFSMLDMIAGLLEQTGPADVTVSTWTIAKSDADRLAVFLTSGMIRSFRLVIDRSFPTRYPEYCQTVIGHFGEGAIRMMRTHAKFAMVGNADWRLTCRASFNLNPNPRCEQFDLDDSPQIYGFFDGYVRELEAAVPAGLDVDGGVLHARFKELFETAHEREAATVRAQDWNRRMGGR